MTISRKSARVGPARQRSSPRRFAAQRAQVEAHFAVVTEATRSAVVRTQIDLRDIEARCAEHRFSQWLRASYVHGDAVLSHRAREASVLVTLFVDERPSAFMLGEVVRLGDTRTLYLRPAAVDGSLRGNGLQRALFESMDRAVPVDEAVFAWGVTAHPASLCTWVRHFKHSWPSGVDALPPSQEMFPFDPAAMWRWLGAEPQRSAHPFVRQRAFTDHEYTTNELDSIARFHRVRPTICAALDAAAGDRMLLVARR